MFKHCVCLWSAIKTLLFVWEFRPARHSNNGMSFGLGLHAPLTNCRQGVFEETCLEQSFFQICFLFENSDHPDIATIAQPTAWVWGQCYLPLWQIGDRECLENFLQVITFFPILFGEAYRTETTLFRHKSNKTYYSSLTFLLHLNKYRCSPLDFFIQH